MSVCVCVCVCVMFVKSHRALVEFQLFLSEVRHLLERVDRDEHRTNVRLSKVQGSRFTHLKLNYFTNFNLGPPPPPPSPLTMLQHTGHAVLN